MNITIVHDDTDSVKLQYLRYVNPRVIFDSCCTGIFTDDIFDKKEAILVLLSKNNWQFSEEIYKSRVKYNGEQVKKRSRLCVVLETDNNQTEEKFKDLIGKNNISVVEDLMVSFKWLPMVCAFIFNRRHMKCSPTCTVPKVIDDSKLVSLHKNLIKGLESIDINVVQDLDDTPGCLILMRKRVTDSSNDDVKNNFNSVKDNGSLIFEYVVHFNP